MRCQWGTVKKNNNKENEIFITEDDFLRKVRWWYHNERIQVSEIYFRSKQWNRKRDEILRSKQLKKVIMVTNVMQEDKVTRVHRKITNLREIK